MVTSPPPALAAVLLLALVLPAAARAADIMPVGVDDAGARKAIYDDPAAQEAFARIGFSFFMYHFWGSPTVAQIDRLDAWAARSGCGFMVNGENATASREQRDPAVYRKPGGFLEPPPDYVARCLQTPRFLGLCYDECEHWICNGNGVTGGRPFMPHFYDAEGGTLEQAYEGNLHNLQLLMARAYPGFAERARRPGQTPVIGTENVFPVLQHLFARAGLVQMPKLLKETITPVTLAMAMGAAKQYRVQHWTSIDLWGLGAYPGHSPEELRSALLISYWTGAERTYIENFNYEGSLYSVQDGKVVLSAHGEAAREFIREYGTAVGLRGERRRREPDAAVGRGPVPRRVPSSAAAEVGGAHVGDVHAAALQARPRFESFAPEIIIVRFPDSDWGQEHPGPWIRRNLYGASNLEPDADTRNWLKIWHVVSHGTIPLAALNYNTPLGLPYRVVFPANNVAVYDHLAADQRLYRSARLVFLTGKSVSPACRETLERLVAEGLTAVTTRRLAPAGLASVGREGYEVHRRGRGRWIVTDEVTLPAVRQLLAPYLGRPDELRYVFGRQEVVFSTPDDPARVQVTVRERR